MRLTFPLTLSTLCWAFQGASASTAHVYTYDPHPQSRSNVQSRSLSATEARLVLAQRAGAEDYHSSDLMVEGVIEAINDFGVRTPLFADEKSNARKALILLASEASDASMPSLQASSSFQLTPAPDAVAAQDLFIDLAKQSDPQGYLKYSDSDLLALLRDARSLSRNGDLFYLAKSPADTEAVFSRLAATEQWSITALILPSNTTTIISSSSSSSIRDFTWGTYTMPSAQVPLHKRQFFSTEAPMADPEHATIPSTPDTGRVHAVQNTSSPLRGILPACYTSQLACEEATRACSGHGACAKKYHDPDVRGGVDCFACACAATTSADGRRTTHWAGPACQKKDVSVEFWLITLFTVGLVGLVGFAVGSVWEMGSEPLPSVIGAGVSGTGARK